MFEKLTHYTEFNITNICVAIAVILVATFILRKISKAAVDKAARDREAKAITDKAAWEAKAIAGKAAAVGLVVIEENYTIVRTLIQIRRTKYNHFNRKKNHLGFGFARPHDEKS
jgi:hypothetical protein